VEGAKALLEEAGYGDGLTLRALGLSDIEPIYVVMQANLAEAGITLELDIPDTAQFVQQAAGGDYDLIVVGEYAAARFPSIFIFFQNAYTFCIGGPKWTTDEINAQIHDFIFAKDVETAKEVGKKFEETMKAQTIQVNLFPNINSSVVAPDLKGFNTLERGFLDPTGFYKG
jgi:peptide/nickel transport system substrate-binding protein